MEHAPKINKVEVRTLQMADYRQLSQTFYKSLFRRLGCVLDT